ncbi:hypothetical protein OCAR_6212 [Afipia carboxidovorans OM5]|nr:hypothetical protein OCAR_6212 [Afipia carboxidovorans OM5]
MISIDCSFRHCERSEAIQFLLYSRIGRIAPSREPVPTAWGADPGTPPNDKTPIPSSQREPRRVLTFGRIIAISASPGTSGLLAFTKGKTCPLPRAPAMVSTIGASGCCSAAGTGAPRRWISSSADSRMRISRI